jgi:hypothetical protein
LVYRGHYLPEEHFMEVIARNLLALSEGLEFCMWFRLGEGSGPTWGNKRVPLFGPDRKPKPGYFAYRLLATMLQDVTAVERIGQGTVYRLVRSGGTPILIGWDATNGCAEVPGDGATTRHVLRMLDVVAGTYRVETLEPGLESVALGQWPVVIWSGPLAPFQ